MMPPNLHEFLEHGEARIRSDVSHLNAVLAEHRKSGANFTDEKYDELFMRVLEACAFQGRGELDYDGCLKALFPFVQRFGSEAVLDRWLPLLRQIAARQDINRDTIHREFLGRLPVAQQSAESPPRRAQSWGTESGPQAADEIATRFPLEVPDRGENMDYDAFTFRLHSWSRVRSSYDMLHRAGWDVWFFQTALVNCFFLNSDYVEQFVEDEEVWQSERVGSLVESLVEPPRPECIGRVPAALLNSRLRYLRPRLYLRFPESPVIRAIAEGSDPALGMNASVEEVGYPFVRSLRLIRDELNRGERLAPRRTMLHELERYLGDVLDRLDLDVDRVKDHGSIEFDPVHHLAMVGLEPGDPVELVHAGLIDRRTSKRLFKAIVKPLDRDSPEHVESTFQSDVTVDNQGE